jgi:Zn ribbon nucleic-acid-binding protein
VKQGSPAETNRTGARCDPMSIPLTQICPQCEADMELLTADDDGEIVVYECPDCGFQVENRVGEDESDDDQEPDAPLDVEEELETFEPDDAS